MTPSDPVNSPTWASTEAATVRATMSWAVSYETEGLAALARLTERLDTYEKALREIQAFQPRRLEAYREHGTVFDVAPAGDPTSWQEIAFWTYTDLCEIESIARDALDGEKT